MANFKEQVNDLTSFGDTDDNAINDCLTAGAKEIINMMPGELLLKCATETAANASELDDFDTRGIILGITRSDGAVDQPCREIPGIARGRAFDSTDLMFYGTESDPVFWKWDNKLKIAPEGSVAIHHVSYPSVAHGDSSISNFADEAEHLVVLYAAIKAAEYLLASEEDDDLYIPIINVLKADYVAGLQSMGAQIKGQQKEKATDSNRQMQALVYQMLEYQKQ